jgi:hypothetical protein
MNRAARILSVPTAVLAAAVLASCGEPTRVSQQPSPEAGYELLHGAYQFVITSSCGERSGLGSFHLSVIDDVVVAVDPLPGSALGGMEPQDFPTIADLFDIAENAEPDAIVDLQVDDDGIVKSLSIDHQPEAIDDEECYNVEDFEVMNRQ